MPFESFGILDNYFTFDDVRTSLREMWRKKKVAKLAETFSQARSGAVYGIGHGAKELRNRRLIKFFLYIAGIHG